MIDAETYRIERAICDKAETYARAVTLEIGPNGSTVMVEPALREGLTRRVFRYMADGSLEWATYDDWRSQRERARFFGFASRELPASMTS